MAEIQISTRQIIDGEIQIDISDHLSNLEIELNDDDIDEAMSEDPVRCLAYLLHYHWDSALSKELVEVLTEVLSPADLLSLACALASKKESAA